MTAVAILWLPVFVVPLVVKVSGSVAATLETVDYIIWAAFVIEYLAPGSGRPSQATFQQCGHPGPNALCRCVHSRKCATSSRTVSASWVSSASASLAQSSFVIFIPPARRRPRACPRPRRSQLLDDGRREPL